MRAALAAEVRNLSPNERAERQRQIVLAREIAFHEARLRQLREVAGGVPA